MRFVPIILFFIYIYLEISLFVTISNSIGVFLTLLCVIFSSFIGLYLIKSQGLRNIGLIRKKITSRQNPTNAIVKSASLLIAGFLFLIPGFLTDILGVVLLLSPVQQVFARYLLIRFSFINLFTRRRNKKALNTANDDDVIEGNFYRKNDE